MVLTIIVRKKALIPDDVEECSDITPGTQVTDGTFITHDGSLIPESSIENVDYLKMYNQTSAKSLKFLYENFFHLVYDQPSIFKTKVKEHLSANPDAHFKLDINNAKLVLENCKVKDIPQVERQQVVNMVDVVSKLFIPYKRDLLD